MKVYEIGNRDINSLKDTLERIFSIDSPVVRTSNGIYRYAHLELWRDKREFTRSSRNILVLRRDLDNVVLAFTYYNSVFVKKPNSGYCEVLGSVNTVLTTILNAGNFNGVAFEYTGKCMAMPDLSEYEVNNVEIIK